MDAYRSWVKIKIKLCRIIHKLGTGVGKFLRGPPGYRPGEKIPLPPDFKGLVSHPEFGTQDKTLLVHHFSTL